MSLFSSIGSMFSDALGGITGGLVDNWLSRESRYSQAHLQDRYNMKYWNLQNEYNSPAAQMQRFREAGLNPNLIYGQTNMAGSVGSVSASAGAGSTFASNILTREQMRNMRAQNDNMVAQNDNLHAQNVLTREQARSLKIDNDLRKNAGQFADAPWYFRVLLRFMPRDKNGDIVGDKTTREVLLPMALGAMSGVTGLGSGFWQGNLPGRNIPTSHLIFGDRGK